MVELLRSRREENDFQIELGNEHSFYLDDKNL